MNDREKLAELLKQMGKKEREQGGVTWYDVADHLLASGVIVLPCKVGDTVWVVFANGIRPYVVDHINVMAQNQVKVRMRFMVIETLYLMADNFGKTVFLTSEEAEAALADMKGDSDGC